MAALQEVRWPGNGECNVGNDGILFYSGTDNDKHINGVGFMVNRNIAGNILRFDAVSDRLCTLRLKSRFSNITFINAYALKELKNP